MYNFRTRRRQNYKQLNNGATSRGDNTRRNSLEGLSYTDTLLPDSPEGAVADLSNRRDGFDDCEAVNNPIDAHERLPNNNSDRVSPSSNDTQVAPNTEQNQVEIRQHIGGAADEGSPMEVDHSVCIPQNSQENTVIVSQNMSGRSLRRLGTSTIQQIVNFPAENLTYGPRRHDMSLQSEQFYSHNHSDSTDSGEEQRDQNVFGNDGDSESSSAEESFKKKYRFGFEDFSMNPFEKPDVATNTERTHLGDLPSEKFNAWLKTSPYGIWVTKYAASEPYAICKYADCEHLFTYEGNPTSSNIIAHLRRKHDQDFELFQKKLKTVQPQLSEFKSVLSLNSKPFRYRRELINFMSANELRINQLNLFIETIIPFSTAEAPAFRKLLECSGAKNRDYICSRKGLVNMMERYEEQFNLQMRAVLEKSFNYNILLDMWTSSNQKSYLAVIVSFCPNLQGDNEHLTIQDVTTNGAPNAHVIDFVDLSEERHTGGNLKQALLTILGKYSIANKISSITVDNGTNNISMLGDLDNDIRGGPGVNKEGGLVKIRCMSHILNRVFIDIMAGFEKSEKSLLSRIDRLTTILKKNVFIRNKMSEFTPKTIPRYNNTRFVSRYKQLSVFLELTGPAKDFYFENRLNSEYQLTPEDLSLFCYEPNEIGTLKTFLRVTHIFHEYTMLLQDDMLNNLPNGIEYYLQIDDFFKSCKEIRNGSTDERHLRNAGLRKKHLYSVNENILCNILLIIEEAYPKFQKYLGIALAEPGYWVAHLLQPFCKTGILMSNFDENFKRQTLELSKRYVDDFLSHFQTRRKDNRKQHVRKGSINRSLESRKKGYKVLKNLRRQNQDIFVGLVNSKSEWELYMEEPIQNDIDYLDYWLANQDKYPTLFQLALSFFHTKLSTADVERCFSISKRVLENRFSLSSTNLKRTMILRNRLKCFGIGYNLQEISDIPLEQWIQDEENEISSSITNRRYPAEQNDSTDLLSHAPDSDFDEDA